MPGYRVRHRIGQIGLAAICAITLQACGGGGGSGGDLPDAGQAQPYSTVSAYGATRATTTSTPLSSEDSQAAEAALQLAIESLDAGLSYENDHTNVLVVPALTAAHLNTLVSAADGETLGQLQTKFPQVAQWSAELKSSQAIQRQIWSQEGRTVLRSFLQATDLSNTWQGGDIKLTNVRGDAALDQKLKALHPYLDASDWETNGNNRLVVVDAWRSKADWSGATEFDGIFESDNGSLKRIPMLRIKDGVKRYSEAGFTAHVRQDRGQTIMTIAPASDSLAAFVSGSKLRNAITHTVAALLSGGSSAIPAAEGELILPSGEQPLAHQLARTFYARSADMAYNEFGADLKRLDGAGGTYAKLLPTSPILDITSSALNLQAATTTAFIFSPRNSFSGGTGSGGTSGFTSPGPIFLPPCRREPDLGRFFLVTLDGRNRVTSMAAIGYAGPANAALCTNNPNFYEWAAE